MTITGYAAHAPKQALKPLSYMPAELGLMEVEVKISHCGICHSDIHLIDNDWGISRYPFIPGHEIIGTVTATGSAVTHLQKGQRVGIGWQRGSCMQCEQCVAGDENMCAHSEATCVGHHGGFAEAIRVDSRFAFAIPDALASENAAPLLCGGVTVFSPMRTHGVNARMRLGVIGIGGLGHLALQFARAFGCEVTAFSSSPDKEKEARGFGADHFVGSTKSSELKKLGERFDFILSTVSADIDWASYVGILAPKGKLCIVGAAPGPLNIPASSLIHGGKTICGSPIGSRTAMREMLEMAARHKIVAKTETMRMAEVNEALSKVRTNKARYRMVVAN